MKTVKVLVAVLMGSFLVSCASKDKTTTTTATTTTVMPAKSDKKVSNSKSTSKSVAAVTTCTNGSDVRILEVVQSNGGCELKYTKTGETNSVANSSNGSSHCNSVKDRIIGKLEAAGHSCK